MGDGFAVGGQEFADRPVAPRVERGAEPAVLVLGHLARALKRRCRRIVDRTDQAGDVARGGRLATALR